MDIAENPEITYFVAVEREYRCTVPPDVLSCGRNSEKFLALESVKDELPADLVAFLNQFQDVGGWKRDT